MKAAITLGTLRKTDNCVSAITINNDREKGSPKTDPYGASRLLLCFCFAFPMTEVFC
jgi:hypothetical protein